MRLSHRMTYNLIYSQSKDINPIGQLCQKPIQINKQFLSLSYRKIKISTHHPEPTLFQNKI